jgi:hypothetical protein
LVERKTPRGWNQAGAIQALANCTHYDQSYNWKAPTLIGARSSLAVYPWNGLTCGGQCSDACLQNVFVGPGTYRFVVVLVTDSTRIAGPPFTSDSHF